MPGNESLLIEYSQSLKTLRKQYQALAVKNQSSEMKFHGRTVTKMNDQRTAKEKADQKILSGMISDCLYTMYWLQHGHEKPFTHEDYYRLSKHKRVQLWEQVDDAISYYGEPHRDMQEMDTDFKEAYYRRQLQQILSCLSSRELELFKLRHEVMLTESECAEMMDVSLGTIKSMAQRTRNKIEYALNFSYGKDLAHG